MDEVFIKRKRTLVLDTNDINKMRINPVYEAIVKARFRKLKDEHYYSVLIMSGVPKSQLPKWMRDMLHFEKIKGLQAFVE